MFQSLIQDILVIFLVSIPLVVGLRRVHFPVIVGFLLAGALIGPQGLQFVREPENIRVIAEAGLSFLLFTIGLEFSLKQFREIRHRILLAAALQIILTFLLGMALGSWIFGDIRQSVYLGAVLTLSSSALVLSVLHARRTIDSVPGQVTTSLLVFQDLAFIPMMLLLPLLSLKGMGDADFNLVLLQKVVAVAIFLVFGWLCKILLDAVLRTITNVGRRELFAITIFFMGVGSAWLAAQLQLSYALGALMGGMLVGSTRYKYQAMSELAPFRYCFNSLFFVAVGMLLNVNFLINNVLWVGAFLLVLLILKPLMIFIAMRFSKFSRRVGWMSALFLFQIGEFSFLIVYQGLELNILTPFFRDLVLSTSVLAMMLTPLVFTLAPKIVKFLDRLSRRTGRPEDNEEKLDARVEQMKDHVIICGFGPLGEALGKALEEKKIPYLVLELNPQTIDRVRKRDVPAFYGDGSSEDLLYHTGIEKARLLAVTVPDFLNNMVILHKAKEINPDIPIITRAKYRNDVQELYAAGANVVISDELESGIEMGRYALKLAGLNFEDVDDYIKRIREFGSADFF